MIELKNLEQVVGEKKTIPLDKGGELETYIGRAIQQFVLHNFGIVSELEIKKE